MIWVDLTGFLALDASFMPCCCLCIDLNFSYEGLVEFYCFDLYSFHVISYFGLLLEDYIMKMH